MLRIKYELISRGISQTEFAKSAGLKPQAVSRIVNGLEPPYTKRGERIAAALGWEGDPSELFEEVTMYAKPTTLGQLQAENAELRELVSHLRTCMEHYEMDGTISCDRCPLDNDTGNCDFERRMSELGVDE